MGLRVRGIVQDIEENSGQFQDGKQWATRHVLVGYGLDCDRVKLSRDMDAPPTGAEVEFRVAPQLKQQANNLLAPYRLDLLALDWQGVLTEQLAEGLALVPVTLDDAVPA